MWPLLVLLAQNTTGVNDFEDSLSIEERKEITQRLADLINDPVLGSTCRELSEKRTGLLAQAARLSDILNRNVSLEKNNPKFKNNALLLHRRKLIYEQKLVNEKIKKITQDFVKTGCPGLNLNESQ